MIYAAIEQAIVWRLRTLAKVAGRLSAAIEQYPDNPKGLDAPAPRARLLIGYAGSSFTVTSEDPVSQYEEVKIEGTLQFHDLRTHSGVYVLLEKIKEIDGFPPIRGGALKPLRIKSFSPKGENGGLWWWALSMTCTLYSGQPYFAWTEDQITAKYPDTPIDPGDPNSPIYQFDVDTGIWRQSQAGGSVLDTELEIYTRPTQEG